MKLLLIILIIFPRILIAQQIDSCLTAKHVKFSIHQLYSPFVLGGAGTLTDGNGKESVKNEIVEERNEHLTHFRTNVDNYLQYSPFVIAYALDAFGVPSKTDVLNRSVIAFKGELIMLASVSLLKNITHQLRPDGSSRNSFPSGHTAQAFAAATLLNEEYKDRYKWMPLLSYGIASSVGLLRMANNRHYVSDVLVGAGMGILSMKIAYWTHKYKWKHHQKENYWEPDVQL